MMRLHHCCAHAPTEYRSSVYCALHRCLRSDIAAYALLVDAKDDAAAAFYWHHGFIALPNSPLSLFLPLATVAQLG